MQTQLAFFILIKVKRVAKKLLATYGACTSLIAVHLQKKLTLDKLRYTLKYAFSGTLTPAEYHAVVSVAHKGMGTLRQFLIQLIKHNVAQ